MARILILHGPNLNLLGTREPGRYGSTTLGAIDAQLTGTAHEWGHEIVTHQSNAEHELVDTIQDAPTQQIDMIIINPAAFTHTSVAIRDALAAVKIPFVEVHLSNIYAREPFRRQSYFSDLAIGVISGFGAESYMLALKGAHTFLSRHD